jgi:predicted nicotinamide N-methyase
MISKPYRRRRAPPDPRPFIQANLPIGPVPGVSEICLHQAHPSSGLWRLARFGGRAFGSPYWAYPWAGGIALARYLLDRPTTVKGLRVLDLGAGGGIVGIAAAKAGAREVIAADIDAYALAALDLNAAANAVAVRAVLGDLTVAPPPAVDLVAIGDLFYERGLADRLAGFLDRCMASGIDVLIGDPGRAYLPRARLRLRTEYPVSDVGEGRGARGMVFSLGSAAESCSDTNGQLPGSRDED